MTWEREAVSVVAYLQESKDEQVQGAMRLQEILEAVQLSQAGKVHLAEVPSRSADGPGPRELILHLRRQQEDQQERRTNKRRGCSKR